MKHLLPILAATGGIVAAALGADATGVSSVVVIDATDHSAVAAAPRLETRASDSGASDAGEIDTATPLAFVLIVR